MASHPSSSPFVVGIFGPIGSGKSTVLDLFREHGFSVWSADRAVHDLYSLGQQGAKRVGEYFGPSFLKKDGSVSIGRLAQMVTHHPLKLRILEHLVHPLVVDHAAKWMDSERRVKKNIIGFALESAVFEPEGLGKMCTFLVRVHASKETCESRVLARGKSLKYFDALYSEQKRYETPYVIHNDGTLSDLKKAFEKCLSAITMATL